MNKFRFTINILAIAIFTLALASIAQAQATRTWVSGVGDDANPCSRTAPCKTFAGAISKTAAQGEINALDSGGFGGVTITKSITIDGDSNIAGVLVSGTNAINVNTASTDDVVVLRNLDINGLGTGLVGIKIFQAKAVMVENCSIYGFRGTGGTNGRGISDERTQGTNIPMLYITNCDIRNNVTGVAASGASPLLDRVIIEFSRIHRNNSFGVFGSASSVISVSRSNVSGNLSDGVHVEGSAQAVIVSSVLTNNQGVAANNVSGTLSLADTTIMNNISGVGGTITSFGNNNVRSNAGGNALPAPVGQQ
ncbi:MAG TPA: right-handed parallel beta-helix repeat-containing protein [Pyrinomonadaceae bacterium]|jgi:hypothetical protein